MQGYDEAESLRVVDSLQLLDTPADPVLDELARAAARLAGCTIGLISLLDKNRHWFKARFGLGQTEISRTSSICDEVIRTGGWLEIGDAAIYPSWSGQALVDGAAGLRFLAGVPLSIDGQIVGTLCVLDAAPRALSQTQRAELSRLARAVEHWMQSWRERIRLREKECFFAQMARQVPGMFFQLELSADGQPRMVYASDGIRSVFEHEPENVRESVAPLLARIHPQDRGRVTRAVGRSARDQTAVVAQWRVNLPRRGWRFVEIHATPERRQAGNVVWSGFAHDVTERRELEHMRIERLAQDRSKQVTLEYVSRHSHELRTPLNAVLGFTQLMQADPQLPAHAQTRLSHVRTAAEHLLDLVNDILDLARIEHAGQVVRVEPTDLASVLESSLALIEPLARARDIQILPLPAIGNLKLLANAQALGQILLNLLSNAVKYNREQGRLWIEIQTDGEMVGICVNDEGKGLTKAAQARLFRPFDRLGQENGQVVGSGLGLVISKQLIESMNGRLEVQAPAAGGSRFIAWLPAAEKSQADLAWAEASE